MTHPYPLPGILGEIERLTCSEVAIEVAHHWGGLRLYIPRSLGRDHALVRVAGRKAAQLLCASPLGGRLHDIPAARAVLRANEAIRLRVEERLGLQEIAFQLGMTRDWARKLLDGIEPQPVPAPRKPPSPALHCPFCGRRFHRPPHRDPRQMALPIATE